MVVSLFASSDHGILIQDAFLTPAEFQILIGVEVPYFYFVRKVQTLFFALPYAVFVCGM